MNIPQTYNSKPLIHYWNYLNADGDTLGIVARYQNGTDKKYIVPYFKRNGSGFTAGIDLNPRPLFGLELLSKPLKPNAVFIVEGEKSAQAMQSLGLCAITSLGGSQAAKQADWQPLSGYKMVYLLPDNDEPGEHYMRDVYQCLQALEQPPDVKVLRLSQLPDKGDFVDWVQGWYSDYDGYSPIPEANIEPLLEELRTELKNAVNVPDDWDLVGFVGSESGDYWEKKPVEISTKLKPVIPFNPDLLPNAFKPWVSDAAHRMQCPHDYVAVAAMIGLSAIVGRKGQITPKSKDDWTVCPNLWGLNIGRPSAMKTPATNEALKPLQRLEIKAKEAFDNALAEDEAQSFINKTGRELAEKQAKSLIKGGKFLEAKQLLIENPEETTKPARCRYIINDATIEKLGELLNENPNGVMLYRDEISGFLKTIDREDRSNDRAFYLEAFNGLGSYTFDRIGRGTIDIESTCVSMLGNIQPGVLRPYLGQASSGNSGDDGMFQRFQLMVWPDLTGWQHVDEWPDKTAKNDALGVFERLADWKGFSEPARFSDEAQKIFNAWFCALHDEIRADDIHPAIESHYGKYKSLIPSIAVLIHLADDEHHSPIVGTDAVKKAIEWGAYLKSHAERVYNSALDPTDANAKAILSKIESGKLLDGFGTRDVLQGGWSGLDSLVNVKAAINRLIEYGWLRQKAAKPSIGAGRPSIRYEINPIIFHIKH